eukprot:4721899-Karenia_brevis.AAC.1
MTKGGSPRKVREGASSLNPRDRKFKKGGEEESKDKLMVDAAVAAANVVLTPARELTVEKSREAQALIEKCKSLSREDVIVDWPAV